MSELISREFVEYANPVKVIQGAASILRLQSLVDKKGGILIVTSTGSRRRGLINKIVEMLGEDKVMIYDQVKSNPTIDDIDDATEVFKSSGVEQIIALGGGSVIDTAKILALTIPCSFSRPIGNIFYKRTKIKWQKKIPLICVSTTSGTGSEVTPFATVWDNRENKKYSISGDEVYPDYAILDPELTLSLNHNNTLYPALDAISHALESLWNKNRSPCSNAFAIHSLALAVEAVPIIIKQPENIDMRAQMQQASLLAGYAISQTRTAIAHSISYPLTSHFGVPHGLACSFTLRDLLRGNLENIAKHSHEKLVLLNVLKLLESIDIAKMVREFASIKEICDLTSEMKSKNRYGNFNGLLTIDFEGLIVSSLG